MRANILPLHEALLRLQHGTLPPRAVAITFDDGAADFHERALPVLRAYQAPATVYLTTYYVQRAGLPVWNVAASYLLWRARLNGTTDLSDVVPGSGPFQLDVSGERQSAATAFVHSWERATTEAKHDALCRLAGSLNVNIQEIIQRRQLQLMTPTEVSQLPQDLIQVELHTHRHRTPRNSADFYRELDENRSVIEDLTGRTPRHFCYPSGHVRREFLPWLRDKDVLSATTCVPGLSSRHHEALLLPRLVDTSNTPDETFAAWMTGTAAWLPGRTRTLAELD